MSKARGLADLGNAYSDGALSNRNVIINGAMQVAQRGTSATAGGYVSLDRYQSLSTGGGAYTFSQETDTPSGQGFKNSAKVTVDTADSSIAAGDYYHLQQNIEGQNIAHFMQGTGDAINVTLSFWVKSSLTGDFGGAFRNDDGSRTRPFQYNISSADTWQKVTKTIQLDTSGTWLTTDGTGLRVGFDLGSGATYQGASDAWASANYLTQSGSVQLIGTSSATWQITGVQLEVGDQATPFEHRSYGDELARCQRYYQLNTAMSGLTYSSTVLSVHTAMVTEMRAIPSIALFDGTNAAVDVGAALRNKTRTGGIDLSSRLGLCMNLTIASTSTNKYHTVRGGVISMDSEL